ncbi:MAG: energy-coupled thiamine transporter ThiT [Lactobacillales bacterium]|jgi:thiamine transporter ThiT|nr:energy-coupled thiamine transporter ThiT [Lactobacillales bacterium]
MPQKKIDWKRTFKEMAITLVIVMIIRAFPFSHLQGGPQLASIPLAIFALRRGFLPSLISMWIYGGLLVASDLLPFVPSLSYYTSPWQAFLDYFVGFGMFAFVGLGAPRILAYFKYVVECEAIIGDTAETQGDEYVEEALNRGLHQAHRASLVVIKALALGFVLRGFVHFIVRWLYYTPETWLNVSPFVYSLITNLEEMLLTFTMAALVILIILRIYPELVIPKALMPTVYIDEKLEERLTKYTLKANKKLKKLNKNPKKNKDKIAEVEVELLKYIEHTDELGQKRYERGLGYHDNQKYGNLD